MNEPNPTHDHSDDDAFNRALHAALGSEPDPVRLGRLLARWDELSAEMRPEADRERLSTPAPGGDPARKDRRGAAAGLILAGGAAACLALTAGLMALVWPRREGDSLTNHGATNTVLTNTAITPANDAPPIDDRSQEPDATGTHENSAPVDIAQATEGSSTKPDCPEAPPESPLSEPSIAARLSQGRPLGAWDRAALASESIRRRRLAKSAAAEARLGERLSEILEQIAAELATTDGSAMLKASAGESEPRLLTLSGREALAIDELAAPLQPDAEAIEAMLLRRWAGFDAASRPAAVELLARVGSWRSLPKLRELFQQAELHAAAARGLARLEGPLALARLARRETVRAAQVHLLTGLAERDDPLAAALVLNLSEDPALGSVVSSSLANASRLPTDRYLTIFAGPDPRQRRLAGLLLARLGDDDALRQVAAMVNGPYRQDALFALAASDSPEARRLLQEAERDARLVAAVRFARFEYLHFSHDLSTN